MVTPADVLAISLYVTDAGGVYPTKKLPTEAAEAIADECNTNHFDHFPWVPGDYACAALYTFHSFRESRWDLLAIGDQGLARGPFQVWERAPATWKGACAQFTRLLRRAAVCDEPLEMLATGKCGTAMGAHISRVRTSGALGVLYAWWMK